MRTFYRFTIIIYMIFRRRTFYNRKYRYRQAFFKVYEVYIKCCTYKKILYQTSYK